MNLLLSVDGRKKVQKAFQNAGLITKEGSSGYITIEQFSAIEKATKDIQEHLQGLDSDIPNIPIEDVERITEIYQKYESITLKLQENFDKLPSSDSIITDTKLTEKLKKNIRSTISNLPPSDSIITSTKLTEELSDIKSTLSNLPPSKSIITKTKLTNALDKQFQTIGEAFKNKLEEELQPIQYNFNGLPTSDSIITDTKLTE